jgi:Holliday junction resolvase RusA-like endonuclease
MDATALPSFSDRPFGAPLDVVLDLPVPPSVNRTRRVDLAGRRKVEAWHNVADEYVMVAKRRAIDPVKLTKIPRFELFVTVSEQHTRMDLDNGIKSLVDYLRRIEVIEDDSYKHMRGVHVTWGNARHGVRVVVRPCE